MAGDRVPGALGRDPFAAEPPTMSATGGFTSPGPTSGDQDASELAAGTKKVVAVTKDWADPPSVTPTETPEVSGKTLKEVLVELKKLSEWGTGGGTIDSIQATSPDKAPNDFTVALKGTFFITIVKWKEYAGATTEQKAAWDAMIVNLKKHEAEHVAIAHRGYAKLIKDLKGKPISEASLTISTAQTTVQGDQDDFDSDAKTKHGANAFGSFPKVELDVSKDPPAKTP